MVSTRYVHVGLFLTAGYLLYISGQIAYIDHLSSIANDSVNYLVMARYTGIWSKPDEAIAMVWQYEDFPIFFPLVLSLFNVADSLLAAHSLVILFGIICIWFLYRLSMRVLGNEWIAMAVVAVSVLMPGYVLGLQGILSESLYILLSLLFLYYYRLQKQDWAIALPVLIALLSTRTIGISMIVALVLVALFRYIESEKDYKHHSMIAALAMVLYICIKTLFGPEQESHYIGVFKQFFSDKSGVIEKLSSQISALIEAWKTQWLIYWLDNIQLNHILVMIVLLLSLSGLALYCYRNHTRIMGWYVVVYLLVLILWPHPGQMVRLLMPVMPLMVLFAVYFIKSALSRLNDQKKIVHNTLLATIVMLSTVLPSHAHIHKRVSNSEEKQIPLMHAILRIPDWDKAVYESLIQNAMLQDFMAIGDRVGEAEVLYYEPSYLAVLGGVKATKLRVTDDIKELRRRVAESGSDYLLLTYYHPRKKRRDNSGLKIREHLGGIIREQGCSYLQKVEISCLYHIAGTSAAPH